MKIRQPQPGSRLEFGSATTIGKVRSNNEDAYLTANPLFAVADGMGGHEAGEIASQLVIAALKNSQADLSDPANLRRLVAQANSEVLDAPRQGIGRVGMGTTLTAAVFNNDRLLVAQVGDSRAYLLRDGQISRLTRDHSYVQELVNSGQISESETRDHPRRGVITRVIGFDEDTRPDLYEFSLKADDRILLCSDGLHGMIDDARIAEVAAEQRTAQQCADALVRAADKAGGQDNTTVVVIDVCSVAPARRGLFWGRKRLGSEGLGLRTGIIGFVLAFCLIVGGTFGGVWLYAAHSAYIIAEGGHVVVYRGLLGDVLGIKLQWQYADTGIQVSDLQAPLPERLHDGIQLSSLEEAEQLVEEYQEQLKERRR